MILSEEDKDRFNKAMEFFQPLLEKDIKVINVNLELKLISFGIPIENQDDILYFDYPYRVEVDEINESLKPNNAYDDVDIRVYELLDSLTDQVKFIAYNYDDSTEIVKISSNYILNLSQSEIDKNKIDINTFFKIMYYSAYPEKLVGDKFSNVKIEVIDTLVSDKWFIVIHNADINESANTVISNYCLSLKENISNIKTEDLLIISERLKTFSKYYGSRDFNIIIKKNVEYLDEALSLNYLVFHHVKKLHSSFTANPIREIMENNKEILGLSKVVKNTEKIQKFYDNYLKTYKSAFRDREPIKLSEYFACKSFCEFVNLLSEYDVEIDVSDIPSADYIIHSVGEYLTIIIEELLLNGHQAFIEQEITVKKIKVSLQPCNYTLKHYIEITIYSMNTVNYSNNILGAELASSSRNRHETGVGLFIINKLLKNLGSYCYDDIQRVYFKIEDKNEGSSGFSITFALPKLI